MDNENKLILSIDAKKIYLQKLSKRLVKILYLIEDELKNTEIQGNSKSPATVFILGQLFEINSSNILFDNALIDVVVKLNGILNYKEIPYAMVRKQIFEAKGIVDFLYKSLC